MKYEYLVHIFPYFNHFGACFPWMSEAAKKYALRKICKAKFLAIFSCVIRLRNDSMLASSSQRLASKNTAKFSGSNNFFA